MPKKLTATALCFVVCFFVSGAALADSKPPPNAKRLSEIVRTLELQGFAPIVEIEFDDGQWEVRAYKDGRRRKVKIDPVTGNTKSDRADD